MDAELEEKFSALLQNIKRWRTTREWGMKEWSSSGKGEREDQSGGAFASCEKKKGSL
jgi:hypothetical protein